MQSFHGQSEVSLAVSYRVRFLSEGGRGGVVVCTFVFVEAKSSIEQFVLPPLERTEMVSRWRATMLQFSVVEQVHDGSELVQLSKDALTQRSPEQHALVTEQCWPAPGQLPA